jgi:putative ABC transport system permease protein
LNIFWLSYKNLTGRPLSAAISLLLIALGAGLISLLLQLNERVEKQFEKNVGGIDMVVGAKGSPMQLILASVLQVEDPTGNIAYAEALGLMKNPMVKMAVPVSFGDNYKGWRIVGTSPEYLTIYAAKISQGVIFSSSMDVIIGAQVASLAELKLGDSFQSSHGLSEQEDDIHEKEYTVVGILESSGTVVDQLILTGLESVWDVHDHKEEHDQAEQDHAEHDHAEHNESEAHNDHEGHDHEAEHTQLEDNSDREITALLLQFRSAIGTLTMSRVVNEGTSMQAAVPAFEISKLYDNLGIGMDTIRALAWIIIIVAGISIFASLYQTLQDRKYEIAVMRSMGAGVSKIFGMVILEALFLGLIGYIIGILLSRIALWVVASKVASNLHYKLDGQAMLPAEQGLLLAVLATCFIAALIPAIRTIKMDVSETLLEA